MDLAHLYADILKGLGDALVKMTSPQWDEMMQAGTAEQRRRAALLMLQTQEARLTLANATLSEIVDKLRENEDELQDGFNGLRTALDRFTSVESVLNGISSVISVSSRLVPLVA